VERFIEAAPGVRLWAEYVPATGARPDARAGAPVLLVMGANASGLFWPDALVEQLSEHHPVIRYDHRDTGRSSVSADEDGPDYGVVDLAADALAVLDAFDVDRAHVVGMSLGGLIAQLLLLDRPERFVTATLFATGPLPNPDGPELPGPEPALLRMWAEMDDPRDDEGELAWHVEHWRLLNGTGTPFDADEYRAMHQRVVEHSGRSEASTAHAHLAADGIARGAELPGVEVPTLVVECPEDPAFPPPNSGTLARSLGAARLVRIPGMGHAINRTVLPPLAAAILSQTTTAART
jgi:pimeloyl-ACP methyl ester carboxylesterase